MPVAKKKPSASKKPDTKKTSDVAEKNPTAVDDKIRLKVIATRREMFHPYQNIRIPTGPPGVELVKDSWLDCQMDRGLTKELK